MDRTPLAHSNDSSASLLCDNRGQKDTKAKSVDVSFAAVGETVYVSRASYVWSRGRSNSRGTGSPNGWIMPHDGKSCQGQTAFGIFAGERRKTRTGRLTDRGGES